MLLLALLFFQQSPADASAAVSDGLILLLSSSSILSNDSIDIRSVDRQLLFALAPAIVSSHASATTTGDGADSSVSAGASGSARSQLLEALKKRIEVLSKEQHHEGDGGEEVQEELAGLLKLRRQILEGSTTDNGEDARERTPATDSAATSTGAAQLLLGGPPRQG